MLFYDACRQSGGSELASCAGFEMKSAAALTEAVAALGHSITVPDLFTVRRGVLRLQGRKLVARYPHKADDPNVPGWYVSGRQWEHVVGEVEPQESINELDTWVRSLESTDNKNLGWAFKKVDGEWAMGRTTSDTKLVALSKTGKPRNDVECLLGRSSRHPWMMVSVPFAPIELPGRQWNVGAPQWKYAPVPGEHPHWDIVLNHIGQDLNEGLKNLDWAKAVGIVTGGDYLRAIIAAILREPFEPTPYIFLFGPENSGKSIFHEAFELLVTSGVVKADRALTSRSDFNGELDGCVLAVVEEKNIAECPGALAKIKDAVTARKLSIRRMYVESFEIDNHVHWVQCANSHLACPKFPGDTRIQPIRVMAPPRDIPKTVLLEALKNEAPTFLHTIKTLTLPPVMGRLRIPLVETEHSRQLESANTNTLVLSLADFVATHPTWQGTAPALSIEIEGAPRDYRALWKFLTNNEVPLARQGVRFKEVPQPPGHKGTRQLQLMRAA